MPSSFHRRSPLTLLDPTRVCSDRGTRAATFEVVPDVIAAEQELSQKKKLAFWQMTQPRPTHTLRVSAAAAQSSVSLVSERALTFLRRRLQSPAALHYSTATDSLHLDLRLSEDCGLDRKCSDICCEFATVGASGF